MDKAFANCSIPQEKSNAEINAELEISDESGEENGSKKRLTYRELESFHPATGTWILLGCLNSAVNLN